MLITTTSAQHPPAPKFIPGHLLVFDHQGQEAWFLEETIDPNDSSCECVWLTVATVTKLPKKPNTELFLNEYFTTDMCAITSCACGECVERIKAAD
jgi:hypothetical protein